MIRTATALVQRYSHVNWALADQTMVSGANFVTGILLARYLGLEEFGRYTLVWMAVLFVNSIQHAMIHSPMMSIGPKQIEGEEPAYYGAVIVQQIVFSCVIFIVLFAGVRWSGVVFPQWKVENLALPLASAAFAYQFQDFLRRYFFTRGNGASAFVNDAIRYLGQISVLGLLFIFLGKRMDTANVLWVITITSGMATLLGMFSVEQFKFNIHILRSTTSRHLHFSKWLTASALMQWTTGNLFIIGAGALLGASAVGALRAAQNIMGITNILFQGLGNIVPVRAVLQLRHGGVQSMSKYLKRVAVMGGIVTATVGGFVSIAPELWLQMIFGKEYMEYGYLLRLFALTYLLEFFSLPLNFGLQAFENTKPIFLAYFGMTCFSVIAVYPLLSNFNLTGVMLGILGVKGIQFASLGFAYARRIKI